MFVHVLFRSRFLLLPTVPAPGFLRLRNLRNLRMIMSSVSYRFQAAFQATTARRQ